MLINTISLFSNQPVVAAQSRRRSAAKYQEDVQIFPEVSTAVLPTFKHPRLKEVLLLAEKKAPSLPLCQLNRSNATRLQLLISLTDTGARRAIDWAYWLWNRWPRPPPNRSRSFHFCRHLWQQHLLWFAHICHLRAKGVCGSCLCVCHWVVTETNLLSS